MSEAVAIDPKIVKDLRDRTNAGMMDCKRALEEAKGNMEEAEKILRKKLGLSAAKKASRDAKEGVIASYIHLGGKVGVLIEINCETDFVAKNDNFREFVKDITLQIAAANPVCVTREEVPQKLIDAEKEVAAAQIKDKPAAVIEKIVQGKVDKYYSTVCLMEQPFIKDSNKTIRDVVNEKIGELGENIVVRRFVRYAVGESVQA
ncbi:MAG: translation elongation factor Ts [Candidatus Methylacidiphilales bacterium]|nr:translation elongation factor Ts [Candidatus Methylacidiphilales bacterium]